MSSIYEANEFNKTRKFILRDGRYKLFPTFKHISLFHYCRTYKLITRREIQWTMTTNKKNSCTLKAINPASHPEEWHHWIHYISQTIKSILKLKILKRKRRSKIQQIISLQSESSTQIIGLMASNQSKVALIQKTSNPTNIQYSHHQERLAYRTEKIIHQQSTS